MSELPERAKDRGHLAELLFAVEAKRRGFVVLTTGGDNAAFDVVLYTPNGNFLKVQIKSCLQKERTRDRHTFSVKRGGLHHHRTYQASEIDIMALYAFDVEEWHFIPVSQIGTKKTIKIDKAGRFDRYKNNWEVFS